MIGRGCLVIALLFLMPACGLEIGESGLACQDEPGPNELLGDRVVPNIAGLEPDEAEAELAAAGIQPSWRYSYRTSLDGNARYSECWCVPPPDGEVNMSAGTPTEQLIVFVERRQPMIGGRPQPRLGWGCEA